MKSFFPTTGTEADWNAAYYRLEDYLRAMHLVNKVRQNQLVLHLLELAAEKHAQDPTRSPTTLVLEEVETALEDWFARILPEEKRLLVVGPVALYITNGAEKWPMYFLADPIPTEFRQAMRENEMRAGPDLQVSSMVPRRMDVPLVEDFFNDSHRETSAGMGLLALILLGTVITIIAFFLRS